MVNPFRYHIPWVCCVILIAYLSFIPGDHLPDIKFEWISIDTLAHFLMYTGLIICLSIGFVNRKQKDKKKLNLSDYKVYVLLILAATLFGYGVELIQGNYIYRRYFDVADIVMNSFGTIFGAILHSWIGRKLMNY